MDEEARNADRDEAPPADPDGADDEAPIDFSGDVPAAASTPPEFVPGELWADELLEESTHSGPTPAAIELRGELGRHFVRHDKAAFVRIAVESVTSETLGIAELYRDVLTPLLADIGTQWQHGHVAVWEEHLAAAMVRTVVEILYPGVLKIKGSVPPAGRSVLLANPPEEHHDLGLRMVADRFDMAGWTTYFLGADAPIDDIVAAAGTLAVDAVVLSSATHFHRLALRGFVDRLERELDHVHVWVGGSAFAAGNEGWASYEIRDIETLLAEFAPLVAPPSAPASAEE